jgi:hypothetical protein
MNKNINNKKMENFRNEMIVIFKDGIERILIRNEHIVYQDYICLLNKLINDIKPEGERLTKEEFIQKFGKGYYNNNPKRQITINKKLMGLYLYNFKFNDTICNETKMLLDRRIGKLYTKIGEIREEIYLKNK